MRKHTSTTVRITESQADRIKRLSLVTKIPQAELIRRGIDIALMKYGYHTKKKDEHKNAF